MDGDKVYHAKVTTPELGSYMATLSVTNKSIEGQIYWSRQTLRISVIANITELENTVKNLTNFAQTLWIMYQNLSAEYIKLKSQFDSLPTAPPSNFFLMLVSIYDIDDNILSCRSFL